jgi:hypothetical protein
VDVATMKSPRQLGPGKYDAELEQDGKAFRPDGESAATLLPACFGQTGVNNGTDTGCGSVTYWNAHTANTQIHGKGTAGMTTTGGLPGTGNGMVVCNSSCSILNKFATRQNGKILRWKCLGRSHHVPGHVGE